MWFMLAALLIYQFAMRRDGELEITFAPSMKR